MPFKEKGLMREFYVDFSLFICDVSNGRSAGVQKRWGLEHEKSCFTLSIVFAFIRCFNFFSGMEGKIEKADFKGVTMVCIGPITDKKLAEKGFTARVVPDQYTIPAMVDAIVSYYQNTP